jgi:hypothetical protein
MRKAYSITYPPRSPEIESGPDLGNAYALLALVTKKSPIDIALIVLFPKFMSLLSHSSDGELFILGSSKSHFSDS